MNDQGDSLRIRKQEREILFSELYDAINHQLGTAQLMIMAHGESNETAELKSAIKQLNMLQRTMLKDMNLLSKAISDSSSSQLSDLQKTLSIETVRQTIKKCKESLISAGFDPMIIAPEELNDLHQVTRHTIQRFVAETTMNVINRAPAGSRCLMIIGISGGVIWLSSTYILKAKAATDLDFKNGLIALRQRVDLVGGTLKVTYDKERWNLTAVIPIQ